MGSRVERHAGRGQRVPVRAVPLIYGGSACGALLGLRRDARRARDVVVRDNRWTHWLKRPIGGVAPVRGWEKERPEKYGGGEGGRESRKQTSANLK